LKYLIHRLAQTFVVLIGITLITFLLMNVVPGDPIVLMLGQRADPATVDKVRHDWGLDKPLYEQYYNFVKGAVRLDLGRSYFTKELVFDFLARRFEMTARLAVFSYLFAVVTGVFTGVVAAVNRGRWLDSTLMAVSILGISAPSFWVAILLQIVFGIWLDWLPITGLDTPAAFVLPCFTLGSRFSASIARFTRTNMLDVVSQDYVRTARAKGLREQIVILKHAFRNALIPVITLSGMQIGGLFAGAMFVETVFSIPGIGKATVDAMIQRDLPVLQGCVMYIATVFVIVNLVVDFSYALIDPRIRVSARKGAKA
jgi:peptide/nickel transport system permease protein